MQFVARAAIGAACTIVALGGHKHTSALVATAIVAMRLRYSCGVGQALFEAMGRTRVGRTPHFPSTVTYRHVTAGRVAAITQPKVV